MLLNEAISVNLSLCPRFRICFRYVCLSYSQWLMFFSILHLYSGKEEKQDSSCIEICDYTDIYLPLWKISCVLNRYKACQVLKSNPRDYTQKVWKLGLPE